MGVMTMGYGVLMHEGCCPLLMYANDTRISFFLGDVASYNLCSRGSRQVAPWNKVGGWGTIASLLFTLDDRNR